MLIRRGQKKDLEQIITLLNRIWGEDDYVQQYWQQWAEDDSSGIVLVAENEGKIVGTTYIYFMPHGSCWFQAMRVDPDNRRLGVGSRLTRESLTEAQSAGRRTAYLGIDGANTASIKMTEQIGFTRLTSFCCLVKPAESESLVLNDNRLILRPAELSDIPALYELGVALDIPGFVCFWQWHPLSRESLENVILEKEIWVAENNGCISAFFGFFVEDSHPRVFAPVADQQDIERLLYSQLTEIHRKQGRTLEFWLCRERNQNLIEQATEKLGFTHQDDYIIWQYEL